VVVVLLAGAAVLGWLVISRIEPDTVEHASPQLDAAGEARPV
jgi:hypothetical protein